MNERIVKLFMESVGANYIPLPIEDHIPSWTEKFAELIVQECANYVRTNLDSWAAEPLAFCMERDFGLHGDYAE